MAPRSTVWKLEDHTMGKHLVLKNYMDAWLPIVLRRYKRALVVDGFAGPGEYRKGEPGSPVIALDALAQHAHHEIKGGQIDYIFVEEDAKRYRHLEKVIEHRKASLPDFCKVRTFNDTYHTVFPSLLEVLESENTVLSRAGQ